MEVDDVLLCYTDGIIEAENSLGQDYGSERLKQLVDRVRRQTSREIFDTIVRDLGEFSEGVGQVDDRTAIVIKRG